MSNDLLDNRAKHLAKRIKVCETMIAELDHIDLHIRNAETLRDRRAKELEHAMAAYDDAYKRVSNLKAKRGRKPEEYATCERNLSFFRKAFRDHCSAIALAALVGKLTDCPSDIRLAFRKIAEGQ